MTYICRKKRNAGCVCREGRNMKEDPLILFVESKVNVLHGNPESS
jgi:hypothetical protein